MIRFLAKVAVQHLLGAIPFGPGLYQRLQTRAVLRTSDILPNVDSKHAVALNHLSLLRNVGGVAASDVKAHLEIGAGWMPVLPLTFRRHGMGHQVLTDITRLLCHDRVPEIARRLAAIDTQALNPDVGMRGGADPLADEDMVYHAPVQVPYAVPSGAFDLVTCIQVLIYPPPPAVRAIHEEAARCLRPGGLYLATIRLDDLYALADPKLSRFNFLRYSSATWNRWFDNRFTPLNRLRPGDHARLLDGLPFERLAWRISGGGPRELEQLARIRLHAEFAHLPPSELAATNLTFLLRRV
ncbi:class I SAM-dependent methyltransferase [Niveispirillum sp. KHB5.9]|uniref:class I SAM-dependent methyltransferase n=1 Tax=Niveispirillum sp. KHB5.9 TaxID=3400269 RepID=UPI003A8AB5C0